MLKIILKNIYYYVYVGIKVLEIRIFDWCKISFDIFDLGWLVYYVYNIF